ncbi:MAG: carcinine hydrolase/isopenicillin-N N-acyltransferase family protein [Hyphomicrobiales bacterium]
MAKLRWKSLLGVSILLWFLIHSPCEACTLWGATGASVEGGGTLIAKNRDWAPDQHQELALLKPADGYRSLALKALGGEEPGVKAGVNEKGLVIVSATADQVPSTDRKKVQQQKGLLSHLLATCASVDDILRNLELMRRPVFYLAGDRREIAVIEIGPEGKRAVMRRNSGTLVHTNHYCELATSVSGRNPGVSSSRRYARMAELLENRKQPFTLEDFIRFSEDQTAGPDNSIWRTGSKPGSRRTLATWVVSVPVSGSPQLYLKTADPGEPEQVCRLSLDAALRLSGGERIPMGAAICQNLR